MWALLQDGKVQTVVTGDAGVTIGDVQHSAQIFTGLWTDREREAVGLLPVEYDAPRDRMFWEEVAPEYKVGVGRVLAERRYKPRDFDAVKDTTAGMIRAEARRLINAVMKDFQQRNSVAELALMLIANGTDLAAWPTEDRAVLDRSSADWAYIKAIRAGSNRREAELRDISSMKDLEAYDWRTGWPLPERI